MWESKIGVLHISTWDDSHIDLMMEIEKVSENLVFCPTLIWLIA
jgi:hypothetical protein